MDPLLFFTLVFLASVLAGTLGALLGLGGGIIVVPVLTLMAGLDIRYAIGASIISVIATSSGAAATYVRDRLTNLRLGMFLEIATTTGAVVGALVAGFLPARVLSVVFGLVLLHAAWTSFRARHLVAYAGAGSRAARWLRLNGSFYDPAANATVDYRLRRVAPGFGMMWLAGLLSGLLGIGSGAFKVIAMDVLMGAPLKVSTTTSNFMIGVTAAASAGVYFFRGDVNPFIAAPVALGVLAGTVAGTRLLLHLPAAAIRRIFVIVLVVLAAQMIWHGVTGAVR
jgi:uncharacterized membrane protein YfcA